MCAACIQNYATRVYGQQLAMSIGWAKMVVRSFLGRTPHLQDDRQFVYISSRMTRQLYTSASLSITVYIHPVLLAALHKGVDDRVVWLHLDELWAISTLG